MKDMLRSKGIIAFVVIMLGISYLGSCKLAKENASAANTDNKQNNLQQEYNIK